MKLNFGIRSKLFLMIAVIIGIIFMVQLFFQAFLMEEFYLSRLSAGVETSLYDVEKALKDISMDDYAAVKQQISDIRSKSDQPIQIANDADLEYAYRISETEESYIAYQLEGSDEVVNIPVGEDVIDYIALNPSTNTDLIVVSGYYSENYDELVPIELEIQDFNYKYVRDDDDMEWLDDESENADYDMDDDWTYTKSNGTLLYYQIGSTLSDAYSYSEDVLFGKMDELLFTGQIKNVTSHDIQSVQMFDTYSNKNNLILFKKLDLDSSGNSKGSYYVFSIISYASIEEPLSIYQEYNWITLAVGTALAFLLVFLFTGRIVKPIKDMERVTSKMAQLNFEERIVADSQDEIGQLATSFNTLSDKLQTSINEMQTLNRDLEKEIEERSRQQEILKAFIANASHELKTPITIMKGLMDGVEDGIYDANSPEHKLSVQDEVGRMEKIVYDLLQVSQMERGAQHIQMSIFEPSDLIFSTYQRHKVHGGQKHMRFHFDFEDAFVKGDVQLIESVIDNLISNSIKYSGEGAEVFCKIHTFEKDVFISVENTLAQIPDADLKQIYEPFFRVDKSHTRKTGGSGLGLSIVKSILELHHSKYEMTNTSNGVKFTFTLPLVDSDAH